MNATPNRSRPDRRPRAGSGLPEREVERTWYRTPRLTLPIPGVREFQSRYEAPSRIPHLLPQRRPPSDGGRRRRRRLRRLPDGQPRHRGAHVPARPAGNDVRAAEIADVGIELDHKLAVLLDALEVPVPSELKE
jgi:hypothetical protein